MYDFIKGLVFVVLLSVILIYLNLSYCLDRPGNNDKEVDIIIEKGFSVKRIGKELVKYDIIDNPKIFVLMKRVFFPRYQLKAGEFAIPPNATIRNVIEIIHKGNVVIHKFTIPEGYTTKEILDKINGETALKGEVTREFKEAAFLPSTYYYTYGETKMNLLERIEDCMKLILDQLWETRAENLPFKDKQQALILASIVEKETGIASERPRIAGVFINRLRKKMKLQADPTVIYGVTLGQYTLTRSLSLKDLRINSPYNTYIYEGLPPTPIASPGKQAIEAVLNPLKTNELYFVADGKGGHNFSANLAIHNNHVNNYRLGSKNAK